MVYRITTLVLTLWPLRTVMATRPRAPTPSTFPTVADRLSPTSTTAMVSKPLSPTRVKPSTLNTNLSTNLPHTSLPHTNQHMHKNTKYQKVHLYLNLFIVPMV